MSRARSQRKLMSPDEGEAALRDIQVSVESENDEDDEDDHAQWTDPRLDGELSAVMEESTVAPIQEGLYVRRDGRWYDLQGNEYRPKRVIRFVWR